MGSYPLDFNPGDSLDLLYFRATICSDSSSKTAQPGHKSYWDFLKERIFSNRWKMTSTTSRVPGIIVANRAAGYETDERCVTSTADYDLTDLFSAGAIYLND